MSTDNQIEQEIIAKDNIPPHQQRVLDEKAELDAKIAALGTFIESNPMFSKLPEAEQSRLTSQSIAMAVYSDILGERIAAFPA